MVFWLPNIDFKKKRKLLALIIVLLTSAWTPVFRDLFLGLMNREIGAGITIGLIVSIFGLFGALALVKLDWNM